MKQVKVTNTETGIITNSAKFATQEEAQAWADHHSAQGNFPEGCAISIEDDAPTQDQINAEARAYLASTDWYVVRFAETGVSVPEEILLARASARASII